MEKPIYDAVIVGSGPNGLAAAICLARRGLKVLIVEAGKTIGGGAHSAELTLPGFTHDICSAIHPLAAGSPFFKSLPLADFGLEFVQPPASLAHPFDDGTATLLEKSLEKTAERLGADGENYRRLLAPFVENWEQVAPEILAPLHFPKHPLLMANFGWKAFRTARGFADSFFKNTETRAVFAGLAAHSAIRLEDLPSAAIGLVLLIALHAVGWGFPRGGAGKISLALGAYFQSLNGAIQTDWTVTNVDELPSSKVVVFDLTPRQIIKIAGHYLPESYRKRLERFRYGAGVFKMDFALSEPIPWRAAACALAATVHLGGTYEEIARAESEHTAGEISEKPFVLLAQNSRFDATRAPASKQTAWAYCHVPNGSTADMSEIIENQIERFAPGFRDCVLAKSSLSPTALERYNANYIGGDINGGAQILSQLFTRPVARSNPYAIPRTNFYICSASTPPGGGVHGMSGFHAAQAILRSNHFLNL